MAMHNAVIEDEQTGEQLMVWAVLSERLKFKNKITGEPIEIGNQGGDIGKILGEHIHHEAFKIDTTIDLVGDPAESGVVGGAGYEIEQYNKLADFSNRNTTFKWTSYMFVQQTSYSQIVKPGLVLGGLGISAFEAIKSNRKPINIIGAKLQLQSVVFTEHGYPITSDEVWDRGIQDLEELTASEDWLAVMGGLLTGSLAGILATAVGLTFWPAVVVGAVAGLATTGLFSTLGLLPVSGGSIPHQKFTCRIDGKDLDFWVRSNEVHGFVTIAIAHDGEFLVRERRITYGEDLLTGVTSPIMRGLHMVALDPNGNESSVTPDNLAKSVFIHALKEA